jgi:cyclopropane fatty-acyl-phospholipid synthase-like methyltransferase
LIDLGTGVGWLIRACDEARIRCLGVEGSADCAALRKCDSELLVADVTSPDFNPGRFDLATSFECIEHMALEHQEAFFRGAARASDRMICSIHTGNGEHHEHNLIRPVEWWTEWLTSRGVGVTVLNGFPLDFPLSCILDLDLRGLK